MSKAALVVLTTFVGGALLIASFVIFTKETPATSKVNCPAPTIGGSVDSGPVAEPELVGPCAIVKAQGFNAAVVSGLVGGALLASGFVIMLQSSGKRPEQPWQAQVPAPGRFPQ